MNEDFRWPNDDHVRMVAMTHLDPLRGTPYWLERDKAGGFQAFENVQTFADFKKRVGFQNTEEQAQFERATRERSLETFIPRSALEEEPWIWASQTGGTTGAPKHGNWASRYWDRVLAFNDELLDLHGVPRAVNWLFMGPMGPHTTGRMVVAFAEHRRGRCFSIDLDPRIVKIFGEEGMSAAYDRYIRHLWEQVIPILKSQEIGVLFCTSRLLEMLSEKIDLKLLRELRAIVHAGTTMEPDTQKILKEEIFPNIPLVGIYGTSTTGLSYQKIPEEDDRNRIIYIPSSPFIVLEVVDNNGRLVDYGEEGNVATYRLSLDSMIPGFWERDRAVRVKPFGQMAERFSWDWIADPYSPEFTEHGRVEGVY